MRFFRWLAPSGDTPYTTSDGLPYNWYYRRRRRNSPAHSELYLVQKFPVDFTIQPEGWFQRLSKSLGFAREFQTNDMTFDKQFYISSDDSQFCNKLRTSAMRQSIQTIFGMGVEKIDTERGRFIAHMVQATPVPDPLTADPLAREMHALAAQINGIVPSLTSPCRSLAIQAHIAIWFMIIMLAAGLLTSFTQMRRLVDYTQLIPSSLMYAVPVIVALFFIIRVVFSGSSRGAMVFATALWAGIPGTLLSSYGAHYYLNVYYDRSEPHYRTEYVTRTYVTQRKRSTNYYVEMENWQKPGKKFSLSTDYGTYSRTRPGSRVGLKTHPGYLGAEWIESYEVH